MIRYDVLIVGAGAAGLAAAAELSRGGRTVCLLEARDRLGGRIHTRAAPGLAAPVELGAEFIHGAAPSTLDWLRRANVPILDAAQARWTLRNGALRPADNLFEEMKRGLAAVRRPRHDLPFSEFLQGAARRTLSNRARQFARTLVEGFDAADSTCVSTLDILDEWSGSGAADAPTFRPLGGYAALVSALASALDPRAVDVRLSTVVRAIHWRRGHVEIEANRHGASFRARAPHAVITLPLGVLKLPPSTPAAVRFEPPLQTKRAALEALAVGPVVKLVLDFREPFWESLDGARYRDAAFLHAPGAAFPTFWSTLPMRTALLSAWTAGPEAARLAGLGEARLLQLALGSLETLFGRRARVRTLLQRAYFHDWHADPYARGAYSYVTAGGAAARRTLAKPIAGTLFFAGEATDHAEAATVAGALQSGRRVAGQVLAAQRRANAGTAPLANAVPRPATRPARASKQTRRTRG